MSTTGRGDDDLEFDDEDDDEVPQGDSTGGIIPYKNPSALIAYYCGIFSLLPCIGLIPGIAGLILGIRGLQYRSRHPEVRGSVHAWIGVVMGGIMSLIWLAGIALGIVSALANR